MTDRAVAFAAPPSRRRLGRATRLAVAGTFAGLLALVLVLTWLQIAVLEDLPSREQLEDLGAAARAVPPAAAPAGAGADADLADRTAGLLLPPPTPALKRELQQRLLAMRLRGVLSPDEIGRVYASAADPAAGPRAPPRPDPRPGFYGALAEDFATAARADLR